MVCCGKEGTRKVITGIDGHTVHGQTLRARRLMEVVPGHGGFLTSPWSESGLIGERNSCHCGSLWHWGLELPFPLVLICSSCHAKVVLRITTKSICGVGDGGSSMMKSREARRGRDNRCEVVFAFSLLTCRS